MIKNSVTKINCRHDVSLVTIKSVPNNLKVISDIFTSIANEGISIDMISNVPPYAGDINLSFTIPSDNLVDILKCLEYYKQKMGRLQIEAVSNNSKIEVFGEKMKNTPGVAASVFSILAKNNIQIKMITTSEIDISILVDSTQCDNALKSLKNYFEHI